MLTTNEAQAPRQPIQASKRATRLSTALRHASQPTHSGDYGGLSGTSLFTDLSASMQRLVQEAEEGDKIYIEGSVYVVSDLSARCLVAWIYLPLSEVSESMRRF